MMAGDAKAGVIATDAAMTPPMRNNERRETGMHWSSFGFRPVRAANGLPSP
jgi:hypothetical protein